MIAIANEVIVNNPQATATALLPKLFINFISITKQLPRMKKAMTLIVAVLVLGTVDFTYAQRMIAEGSVLGSGSLHLMVGKDKFEYVDGSTENDLLNLAFLAWGAYTVKDNLLVGAGTEISSMKPGNGVESQFHLAFGPLIRYYFAEGPFVQGFYGFGTGSDKYVGTTTKYSQSNWHAVAGYSVRISDVVLFDPQIGYRSVSFKQKDSDNKYINSGLYIQLGFTIIFVNK